MYSSENGWPSGGTKPGGQGIGWDGNVSQDVQSSNPRLRTFLDMYRNGDFVLTPSVVVFRIRRDLDLAKAVRAIKVLDCCHIVT